MIEVFPLIGMARELDQNINRAAIYLLVLLIFYQYWSVCLKAL